MLPTVYSPAEASPGDLSLSSEFLQGELEDSDGTESTDSGFNSARSATASTVGQFSEWPQLIVTSPEAAALPELSSPSLQTPSPFPPQVISPASSSGAAYVEESADAVKVKRSRRPLQAISPSKISPSKPCQTHDSELAVLEVQLKGQILRAALQANKDENSAPCQNIRAGTNQRGLSKNWMPKLELGSLQDANDENIAPCQNLMARHDEIYAQAVSTCGSDCMSPLQSPKTLSDCAQDDNAKARVNRWSRRNSM